MKDVLIDRFGFTCKTKIIVSAVFSTDREILENSQVWFTLQLCITIVFLYRNTFDCPRTFLVKISTHKFQASVP